MGQQTEEAEHALGVRHHYRTRSRERLGDWFCGRAAVCYTQAPTLAKLEANLRKVIQVYMETLDEQ